MTASMQLIQRLSRYALQKPSVPAYVDAGLSRQLTWKELHDRATDLAARLKPESVVLIRIPNSCDFPIAFFAALIARCTAFPLSVETPQLELASVAAQTGAAFLIESAGLTVLPPIARQDSAFRDREVPENRSSPRAPHESLMTPSPEPGGLMLLSSGSTGKPKIVCRSVASLDAVCDQMCRAICIGDEDRALATVPLCHSYGLEHGLLAPMWAGATVHLIRGLDLSLVQRELLQSRITLLPAVPSAFEMLGNLTARGEHFPSLRAAYSAGAPLPMSVSDKFFDRCGVRIGQVFGATEIGSVTYSDPLAPDFNPASVGKPMPGVQFSLRDGHLYVSAASMFTGYLDQPSPVDTDGFYPTGDLAAFDDCGNLLITGRSKLLIDIGGLKVNPVEVEQVIMQHPGVGDCVVIPVQQSETVVRLKAVFTLRSGSAAISTEDLRQFARERLAGYKVPRSFELRDQIPRSAAGKILRQQVT